MSSSYALRTVAFILQVTTVVGFILALQPQYAKMAFLIVVTGSYTSSRLLKTAGFPITPMAILNFHSAAIILGFTITIVGNLAGVLGPPL